MMATEPNTCGLLKMLHDSGVTYQSIANDLGVSWRTIYRWSREETHPNYSRHYERFINETLLEMLNGLHSSNG